MILGDFVKPFTQKFKTKTNKKETVTFHAKKSSNLHIYEH